MLRQTFSAITVTNPDTYVQNAADAKPTKLTEYTGARFKRRLKLLDMAGKAIKISRDRLPSLEVADGAKANSLQVSKTIATKQKIPMMTMKTYSWSKRSLWGHSTG
ncbi:unnamed protein product [Aphanomyces euteiches]